MRCHRFDAVGQRTPTARHQPAAATTRPLSDLVPFSTRTATTLQRGSASADRRDELTRERRSGGLERAAALSTLPVSSSQVKCGKLDRRHFSDQQLKEQREVTSSDPGFGVGVCGVGLRRGQQFTDEPERRNAHESISRFPGGGGTARQHSAHADDRQHP